MRSKIRPKDLRVLFRDPENIAHVLRYAIEHCERCLRDNLPADRFKGLGGHAGLFAHADSASQWLELLWVSTASDPELRLQLIAILKRIVGDLPACDGERRAGQGEALRLTVPAFLGFVRLQRVPELISSLRARAFGPSGWLLDDDLRAGLLLAAYANVDSVEVFEFLDHLAKEPRILARLDYAQFSVFCAEFITSARARLMELQGTRNDPEFENRLNELMNQAYSVTQRPMPLVASASHFGAHVVGAIEEAIDCIELPRDLRDCIDELIKLLKDPQPTELAQREMEEELASFGRLVRDELSRQGSASPAASATPEATKHRTTYRDA